MNMFEYQAAGLRSPPRTPSKEEVDMKRLMSRRLFDSIDADGGGTLDSEEMSQLFAMLGLSITKEQEATIMAKVDADGSGEVDFDEFFNWYNSF